MSEQVNQDSSAARALGVLGEAMLEPIKPQVELMISTAIQAAQDAIGVKRIELTRIDGSKYKVEGLVHPMFERALRLVNASMQSKDCIVLLKGPAGCGKTKLASDIFKAMGLARWRMFTGSAGLSESHIGGRLLPTGAQGSFEYCISSFVDIFENGGGFFCDEVDGMDPNVLLTLNPAIANGVYIAENRAAMGGNAMVRRHDGCALLAAANTFGTGADSMYVGRNQLDASFLDRCIVLTMDYDRTIETALGTPKICDFVWNLREKTRSAKLRREVSTRMIKKAALMEQAGDSWTEIRESIFEGWTRDELSKVGESIN